jgi:hypothetical protein
LTIGSQNHDIVRPELLWLLNEARCQDIKDYDASRPPAGAPGLNSSSHSQAHGRQDHQRDRLTTAIAAGGGEATHLVKVRFEPIRRPAERSPVHGSKGEKNHGETDRLGRQHSPALSFLVLLNDPNMKVAGSPGDRPIVITEAPTPTAPQSGFDSLLNGANPTVESIADAQRFDGSFSTNDGFVRLLTGSSSMPSLPDDLATLPGSVQEKQTIWITILALAVFAKNLPEDEVSWTMLAEKAENFVRTSLASLGVDAAGVTAMVSRLKRAAAKYVAFKFWFPILKRSDSSVVILVVSIDG